MRLGVIMDPIENIDIKKDTSFELMLNAQRMGLEVSYIDPNDIYAELGEVYANIQRITVQDELPDYYQVDSISVASLAEMDAILMRVDPPVTMDYVSLCQLLETAERRGTLVVNSPRALRSLNEKLTALVFYDLMPPTLVTNSREKIELFLETYNEIVIKPIHGMGGAGIFLLGQKDPNRNVILETLTAKNQILMAQLFLPEIVDGDRRVLVVHGEVVPHTLARIPQKDEFRGNLAAGGKGVVMPIQRHELAMAQRIAKWLAKRGVLFAGLDIIGNYLTEINITSPTCVREIEAESNYGIAHTFLDQLMPLSNSRREIAKSRQKGGANRAKVVRKL